MSSCRRAFFTGIVVFRSMRFVITPPAVSCESRENLQHVADLRLGFENYGLTKPDNRKAVASSLVAQRWTEQKYTCWESPLRAKRARNIHMRSVLVGWRLRLGWLEIGRIYLKLA